MRGSEQPFFRYLACSCRMRVGEGGGAEGAEGAAGWGESVDTGTGDVLYSFLVASTIARNEEREKDEGNIDVRSRCCCRPLKS
jgi:hypothetical protein